MIQVVTYQNLSVCSHLIQTVISETNSKYYSPEIIEAWKRYNSLENLEKELKEMNFIYYQVNDIILGTGAIKENHIQKVYVLPDYQGLGIGAKLVNALEKIAQVKNYKECNLNSTINALNFYKPMGYQEEGIKTLTEGNLSVNFTKMRKSL